MELQCPLYQRQCVFGVLIAVVLLVGCGTSTTPTVMSSAVLPTTTPLASVTPLLPTSTPTPTSSPMLPTATPSPTLTPMPPTITPIPTLAASARPTLVREMLKTNGGCELPCWWGITPGQTDWLAMLGQCESYGDCDFDMPESTQLPDYIIRQHFDQQGGKVRSTKIISEIPGGRILESFPRDWRRYALDQVLTRYGKPSQVLLELSNYCADPPCGSSGYGLYVVYDHLVLLRDFALLRDFKVSGPPNAVCGGVGSACDESDKLHSFVADGNR